MKKFTQLNESKEEFNPKELEMGIKVELPSNIISDFESFVRDYNIDEKGQNILGAILRKVSTE